MTEPIIFDKKPVVLELESGDYYYCTCGKSANQPFCDGKHKDSGFTPFKFTLEEKQKVALCLCKHSQNAPFCDGSHTKL